MKTSLRKIKRGTGLSAAVLGASALALAGCGAPPAEQASGSPAAEATDYRGCIVSDSGGFDDRSFNQSSYEGLKKAEKDLGIKTKEAESRPTTDFDPNVRRHGAGRLQPDPHRRLPAGRRDQGEQRRQPGDPLRDRRLQRLRRLHRANVKPIVYDTAQAAFLAGYAAAATTKTGKVATYGGMNIPTVTIFMDGFADGVDYYNEQKGRQGRLLGWDRVPEGLRGQLQRQDDGQEHHP